MADAAKALVIAVFLLSCGRADALSIAFDPPNPASNQNVVLVVQTGFEPFLDGLDPLHPITVSGSTIRVTAIQTPIFVPAQRYTFLIGAYPAGVYRVEFYTRFRSPTTPIDVPPQLAATGTLVIQPAQGTEVPAGSTPGYLMLGLLVLLAGLAKLRTAGGWTRPR